MEQYKKISSHGSVNIPAAMRRELGLEPRDPMILSTNGDGTIVLKAYLPRCIFCGGQEEIHKVSGRNVCFGCARKLYEKIVNGGMEDGGSETEDQPAAGE